MSSSAMQSVKRALLQPAFVILVLVLGVCAATLNTAAARMKVHFQKQPLELRVASLKSGIPAKLGRWIQVGPDQSVNPEIEQVLGTSQYVFRDYVDGTKVPQSDIDFMNSEQTTTAERESKLAEWQARKPDAVIRAAVTYYTGMVDTVAHVPERCYVADGFDVTHSDSEHVALGNYPDGKPRELDFRFLGFEDMAGGGNRINRVARNVGYVFHCNGQYMSSAYAVRQHLQNLFERYGYYAKVELMTAAPLPPGYTPGTTSGEINNRADSIAAMESFLSEILPHVEKCLPDWDAVHRGGANGAAR